MKTFSQVLICLVITKKCILFYSGSTQQKTREVVETVRFALVSNSLNGLKIFESLEKNLKFTLETLF